MASATVVSTRAAFPLAGVPRVRSPRVCSVIFLLCDAAVITVTASAVLLAKDPHEGASRMQSYLALWPALGVFLVIFASSNLYPGILHNAVTELRRLGLALTISFLVVAGLISVNRSAEYPRRGLLLWWIAAMVMTPLCRSAVRHLVCHRPWWGIPVAVFHTGDESAEIIRELEIHPEIGLRPVAILSLPHAIRSRDPLVIPLSIPLPIPLPILDVRCAAAIRASGVERALIVLPDRGGSRLLEELEIFESIFPRLMILHSPAALYSLTVDARQIGGSLAVEVRRDLLLPLPRFAKRTLDLLIVGLSLPMVTVMILLLGLMVRLESPGPIFFSHRRIGRDRSTFFIWKIRSMQVNGEELLQRALQDGVMRDEWTRDRKLRHDPRITRVGKFLRRTSLDELPQVWNVLRGEMSLVGPRPIVEEEVATYGQNFSLYCRVTPGLTGLWQVSGRSMVGSTDRVRMDSYYVRNWSPWLDLHILGRTAKAVLTGRGAY